MPIPTDLAERVVRDYGRRDPSTLTWAERTAVALLARRMADRAAARPHTGDTMSFPFSPELPAFDRRDDGRFASCRSTGLPDDLADAALASDDLYVRQTEVQRAVRELTSCHGLKAARAALSEFGYDLIAS